MILVFIFLILLFSGIPIAFALSITAFLHLFSIDGSSLLNVTSQRMLSSVNNFSLLAIPFFVLAGELMNAGGITTKLLNFSKNLMGHFKGGLAYVNVIIGLLLGAIVGSANAEAAIRSKTVVPEMEKDGFDRPFAAALTATSSTIGPIHPPSMTFIIYGVVASASIGGLFMAGIIPAVLIALIHFIIIYFYVRKKKGLTIRPRATFKQLMVSLYQSIPALLIPIIILGGIYSGYFTPTESGAIACVIAILIGKFFYKTLKWSDLPKVFLNTGVITASVTFIIASANILGWSLSIEQVPQMISEFLLGISENKFVILLIINLFLLFVGMFMETTAAILILVPILLPVVLELGVDPIHFGVIVCLNLTIGLVTPPVGIVLFIVSSMTKLKLQPLIRASVPFLVGLIIVLFILTYVPELSMWLPNLLGY